MCSLTVRWLPMSFHRGMTGGGTTTANLAVTPATSWSDLMNVKPLLGCVQHVIGMPPSSTDTCNRSMNAIGVHHIHRCMACMYMVCNLTMSAIAANHAHLIRSKLTSSDASFLCIGSLSNEVKRTLMKSLLSFSFAEPLIMLKRFRPSDCSMLTCPGDSRNAFINPAQLH